MELCIRNGRNADYMESGSSPINGYINCDGHLAFPYMTCPFAKQSNQRVLQHDNGEYRTDAPHKTTLRWNHQRRAILFKCSSENGTRCRGSSESAATAHSRFTGACPDANIQLDKEFSPWNILHIPLALPTWIRCFAAGCQLFVTNTKSRSKSSAASSHQALRVRSVLRWQKPRRD